MIRTHCLILFAMLGFLAACGDKAPAPSGSPRAAASTNIQTFEVKGVVKRPPNIQEKEISITHEAIPNYMPAMTMPFNVKDTAVIQDLQPGDAIEFRLNVTEDESWIDQVKKTGVAPAPAPPPERPSVRVVRDVEPLAEGDMMPDYAFTNDVRQVVKLSDFKGKSLAFTFIFTRCPLPDFCPLMLKNFHQVYKRLKARTDGPSNWHLLAISFDPHYDTPEVLNRYGALYPHDRASWDFVTGAMIDIDAITDQFGVEVTKDGASWGHKLRTVVIDATGKIQKILPSNGWTVDELEAEIVKGAQATQPAR